jgi:hypothetical protein
VTKWNQEYQKNLELKQNLLEFPIRDDPPQINNGDEEN